LTAADNAGTLDKEATSYNDIFDAFRSAKFYHFQENNNVRYRIWWFDKAAVSIIGSSILWWFPRPKEENSANVLVSSKVSGHEIWNGAIYSIPQMAEYLTRISFNCQTNK
jgi:hypothetical protein